jgi:glycosyltransferase involved in cell wall biosynthesis
MYKNNLIAVVLPAHNEARHIGQTINDVPEFVDNVIVVDDCSSDDTLKVASACGDSRVICLQTPENQGVGGAMTLGYRRGIELNVDIIVKMDGDGQMPPEHLPLLLDAITDQSFDYAKGNRFLVSKSLGAMPKHRLFGSIVLTFMNKLASGYWQVFDPQNGYTAVRTSALKMLDLESIHKRYFFENDMLCQLNYHAFRVKDVGIPARYGEEESGLNPFKISLTFPFLLLRRFLRRIYHRYILIDFSPIALFLLAGSILFLWGMLFGIYVWSHSFFTGRPALTGTIMLALVPLILGFQLLLQAIVLDIHETPR